MLNKRYRLPKNEIVQIVRKGKRIPIEGIDLKVWYDDSLDFPKFCFIVPKKVAKHSTARNRIKRILRAKVYKMIKANEFKKGKYVFVVRQELADYDISN